jgi:hypothetical protein
MAALGSAAEEEHATEKSRPCSTGVTTEGCNTWPTEKVSHALAPEGIEPWKGQSTPSVSRRSARRITISTTTPFGCIRRRSRATDTVNLTQRLDTRL